MRLKQNYSFVLRRRMKAILCYKGPYDDGFYPGFELKKDKKIIRNILLQIYSLEKTYMIKQSARSKQNSSITQKLVRKILNLDKQHHLSTAQIFQLIQKFKCKKLKSNKPQNFSPHSASHNKTKGN